MRRVKSSSVCPLKDETRRKKKSSEVITQVFKSYIALPMNGPDQASFYYFNFKMVGTSLWSWVSIFAQPNSLPKSQPMEPKCVVMEDSHAWSGLVSHTLVV
jgi:hypothetical protein